MLDINSDPLQSTLITFGNIFAIVEEGFPFVVMLILKMGLQMWIGLNKVLVLFPQGVISDVPCHKIRTSFRVYTLMNLEKDHLCILLLVLIGYS